MTFPGHGIVDPVLTNAGKKQKLNEREIYKLKDSYVEKMLKKILKMLKKILKRLKKFLKNVEKNIKNVEKNFKKC